MWGEKVRAYCIVEVLYVYLLIQLMQVMLNPLFKLPPSTPQCHALLLQFPASFVRLTHIWMEESSCTFLDGSYTRFQPRHLQQVGLMEERKLHGGRERDREGGGGWTRHA